MVTKRWQFAAVFFCHQTVTFHGRFLIRMKGKNKGVVKMNGMTVNTSELLGMVKLSSKVELRLYVGSMDGYVGVKKNELIRALKYFTGPDCCQLWAVYKTEISVYVHDREVWHIQGEKI